VRDVRQKVGTVSFPAEQQQKIKILIRNVDDDSDCYQSAVAAHGRWVIEATGEMKTLEVR
jgi:hypothetical protein